jgi:hypothetical protein
VDGAFSTIVVNDHFEGYGAIIYRHACNSVARASCRSGSPPLALQEASFTARMRIVAIL